MSRVTSAPSPRRTTKDANLTKALRQRWTQARLADRELMALRTHLSRHSG